MRKIKIILTITLAAINIFIAKAQDEKTAIKSQEPKLIPGQFIVVLKESAAKPVTKQQIKNNDREQKVKDNQPARDNNLRKVKELRERKNIKESSVREEYADVIVGFSANLTAAEADALKTDPDVEGVYPDYEVRLVDNSERDEHAAVANPAPVAQSIPCGISNAGGPVDGSTKTTVIWILDTGIDTDHEDLNVITTSSLAKSFISGETIEDGQGHGTHCAGIAAAKNNSVGVVGVSAGAKVVPVKVLNNADGSGTVSGIIAGLNHVATVDKPGDVVSMSLGAYPVSNCSTSNTAYSTAIKNLGLAGTFVCIAAGNDDDCIGATKCSPGCFSGTNVFTIGALNCSGVNATFPGTTTTFSNWGSGVVDWAAVGSGVLSTCKGGGYCSKSGTSMATPTVAGIIHANGSIPVSGGTSTICGSVYKKAHTGTTTDELAIGASKTIDVEANDPFVHTGIHVQAGQKFKFTTSTANSWKNGFKYTDCNGYDGIPVIDSPRHNDLKMMRLVGEFFSAKNNDSSSMDSHFDIGCGSTTPKTMAKTGYIVVFANDNSLLYGDNSLDVTLTITRTQ